MGPRSIYGAKKWARLIRFGATAAPLDPDLAWVDTDMGRTKVRDYPKPVESCASTTRWSGYCTVQGHIQHVSHAQGRHPHASTAPTWLWLLAFSMSTICD